MNSINQVIEQVWLDHQFEPMDETTLASMSAAIQQMCPGNYKIQYCPDYERKSGVLSLSLNIKKKKRCGG